MDTAGLGVLEPLVVTHVPTGGCARTSYAYNAIHRTPIQPYVKLVLTRQCLVALIVFLTTLSLLVELMFEIELPDFTMLIQDRAWTASSVTIIVPHVKGQTTPNASHVWTGMLKLQVEAHQALVSEWVGSGIQALEMMSTVKHWYDTLPVAHARIRRSTAVSRVVMQMPIYHQVLRTLAYAKQDILTRMVTRP